MRTTEWKSQKGRFITAEGDLRGRKRTERKRKKKRKETRQSAER